jgi:hypothetical protein
MARLGPIPLIAICQNGMPKTEKRQNFVSLKRKCQKPGANCHDRHMAYNPSLLANGKPKTNPRVSVNSPGTRFATPGEWQMATRNSV